MSDKDALINELIKQTEPDQAFPPPGDFHSANTVSFFGMDNCRDSYFNDPKGYKDKFRGVGKMAGLALVYGSSWKLFLGLVPNCTESHAHHLYDSFFKNLPVLTRYDKNNIKAANKNKYIKTFLNRLIYVDTLDSENWGLRAKGERQVKNLPIQGAGSEIIKYMLLKVFNFIDKYDLSRWKGTYLFSDYYTRILTVDRSDLKDDFESYLDAQPKGNCKVLIWHEGEIVSEYDRSVQLTQEAVDLYKMEIVL